MHDTCVIQMYADLYFLDQLFSRIAHYLKQHDAHDRKGILRAISEGFSSDQFEKPAFVKNLDRAANISACMNTYLGPTPNLTQFRQFKLQMYAESVCVLARYRCADVPNHNDWLNLDITPASTPKPVQKHAHK